MTSAADWTLRYTATEIGFPAWAEAAPDRLAFVSNRSGSWQAWSLDRSEGAWRQVSEEPIGVEAVQVLPDGRIAWFQDDTGEETGRWVARPFGEDAAAAPLFPALPTGWSMGMAMTRGGRAAVGLEVKGEYRIWVVEPDGGARELASSSRPMGVGGGWPPGDGGIAPDGGLVVAWHTEHGDILHPALRVLDSHDGTVVGEVDDGRRRLDAGRWSPDGSTFAFTSERGDRARPGIWDRGGTRRDLEVDLPGDVYPVAWYPDGALLVRHEFEARAQLFRAETDGVTTPVTDLLGDIDDADLRPDGEVWLSASDGVHPPAIVDAAGAVVIESPDPPPPDGAPLGDRWVENPHGDRIQALVLTPEGDGPHPLVLSVHGGPEWHERHRWDAETLAFRDAGYAVALVNYRGSTGYGVAFREALIGDVCHCETEDLIAVLDALVADGTADPARVYWSGWSWGGCLACFNAGVHPGRWRAIFAGIPSGDFVAAHRACAPELQAWDLAVYGGGPDEVPEAYARSNPMTYVDAVTAPTIVIAGEHDPRCPLEGVTPWVDAVRANGVEVVVHTYGAGHHANETAAQVAHMRLVLDFFAAHA